MRFDGNGSGSVNYEPNSAQGPFEDARLREPPLRLHGDADRHDPAADLPPGDDDFRQAGDLYRLMSEPQRTQLIGNLCEPLRRVPRGIQLRQLALFSRADEGYGARVAEGLGIHLGPGSDAGVDPLQARRA